MFLSYYYKIMTTLSSVIYRLIEIDAFAYERHVKKQPQIIHN
jgi:hypothetical protein